VRNRSDEDGRIFKYNMRWDCALSGSMPGAQTTNSVAVATGPSADHVVRLQTGRGQTVSGVAPHDCARDWRHPVFLSVLDERCPPHEY